MARRKKGRQVNGVLLLHKPTGMSSNRALQQARQTFFAQKAGHTGSLDPLATGLLPVCFGEATKFSQFLLNADKRYEADVVLGVSTDAGDSDGQIVATKSAKNVTKQQLEEVLEGFRGAIEQVPPMYSALKHQGQPLYKLARQGIMLERKPRSVTIHSLELLAFSVGEQAQFSIDVSCSKGTYIRSLAMDIGELLAVGGHIAKLHRTEVDSFTIDQAITLETLKSIADVDNAEMHTQDQKNQIYKDLDALLLPIEDTLIHFPQVTLDESLGRQIRLGQAVEIAPLGDASQLVRLSLYDGSFIGLGELNAQGVLSPKRLIAQDEC